MFTNTLLKMRELELEFDGEDSYIEESDDFDTCNSDEINRLFTKSYKVTEKVIAKNKYILHIAGTSENQPNVAVALSDNTCEIHSLSDNQLAKLSVLAGHKDKIVECRFSSSDSNLLYTGSCDGSIKLWDLRMPNHSTLTFLDTTVEGDAKNKVFTCFDVSCNGRLLAAGTDLFEGDAFLLFWDIRNKELLGGYWESHTDDITQVKFHPNDRDKLISGSTDGLINLYDLSQTCEDDALIDTLNTESSIEHLLWFSENGKDNISCITHTSDLQLWNVDGAEPYRHISRADIAREIKKKSEDYIYLANCHMANDSLLVLAGSNFKEGECLRSLYIERGQVQPAATFQDNKQRVRSSWYNENTNILLTGGEKGILNVWMVEHTRNNYVKRKKIK